MSTSFFEQQARARTMTTRLIFLYILAVAAIVFSVVVATEIALSMSGEKPSRSSYGSSYSTEPKDNSGLRLFVGLATLGAIVIGSVYRIAQLGGDGSHVATALGGVLVPTNTDDPGLRKLLNVVEEMAIASGIPVPKVYLLPNESSLNAFAAGTKPTDAVIGVTQGLLERLSRDELQGVIAHEFSHIFNGDMRLNIRLMGVLGGILFLTTIGRIFLQSTSRRSSSKKNDGGAAIALVGLGLIVVGWIGVFFARLIKAAVSRQREFLADASAVQYTRNPQGIGGALLKIRAASQQSVLQNAFAEEASHMFFGSVSKFSAMFATHPPLDVRLEQIAPGLSKAEPPKTQPVSPKVRKSDQTTKAAMAQKDQAAKYSEEENDLASAFMASFGAASTAASHSRSSKNVTHATSRGEHFIEAVGNPQEEDLTKARDILDSLPHEIREATRSHLNAKALVLALLIDGLNGSTNQNSKLNAANHVSLLKEAVSLRHFLQPVQLENRLAILELACPALRELSNSDKSEFLDAIRITVFADDHQTIFEYVALAIIEQQLKVDKKKSIATLTHARVSADLSVVLSALAYAGSSDELHAARAFSAGADALKGKMPHTPSLCSPDACKLPMMNTALERLSYLNPQYIKHIVDACQRTIWSDKVVHRDELELFKGICVVLQAPLPAAAGDQLVG